jgi:hypothetical protein
MRLQSRNEKPAKGEPVPTRFEAAEDAFLKEARLATGLARSELIRRAVRLAKRQCEVLNGNYQFLLNLTP